MIRKKKKQEDDRQKSLIERKLKIENEIRIRNENILKKSSIKIDASKQKENSIKSIIRKKDLSLDLQSNLINTEKNNLNSIEETKSNP